MTMIRSTTVFVAVLSLWTTGIIDAQTASPEPSLSPSTSSGPSLFPSTSSKPSLSPSISLSPSTSSPSTSPPSKSLLPSNTPSVSLEPSLEPTLSPSLTPSLSLKPSVTSSKSPTESPEPSPSPSITPSVSFKPSLSHRPSSSSKPSVSIQPSLEPSLTPTKSLQPSTSFKPSLSFEPSSSTKPSENPSISVNPTNRSPSISNSPSTSFPSVFPSTVPSTSKKPSSQPSTSLTPSSKPTASPKPSPSPSITPSTGVVPSVSKNPSQSPSNTVHPTKSPKPSAVPTAFLPPSAAPTDTFEPTPAPSGTPTKDYPSAFPSESPKPSPSPSKVPSASPSNGPSISSVPSEKPSVTLSDVPSETPSKSSVPSETPSLSSMPSIKTSSVPSTSFTPSESTSPSYGSGTIVGMKIDMPPQCPPLDINTPFNADIDDNGTNDAWGGILYSDLLDNTIQVVCLVTAVGEGFFPYEYHVMVNGKSAGKSPWPGGRNQGWIYGKNYNGIDGMIEFVDGTTTARELVGTLWESKDGPLIGEHFLFQNGTVSTNATVYTKDLYDAICDEDGDGKVDVNVYSYTIGDLNAIKRHFEENIILRQEASFLDPFKPGDPDNTPDNFVLSGISPDSILPEEVDFTTMTPMQLLEEQQALLTSAAEELFYQGSVYDIKFELTNGLPMGVRILDGNIIEVSFQPSGVDGTASVSIPFTLIQALGFRAGYPCIINTNSPNTIVTRTVSGGNFEFFNFETDSEALAVMTLEYQDADEPVEECTADISCGEGVDPGFPEVCSSDGGLITFQKCCCLLGSCTWKVGLTGSCPGFCFSSLMKVREESKGIIPIYQVQVGDKVRVDTKGTYDYVTSWSHYQPDKNAIFLQVTAGKEAMIELSSDHMIFVNNNHRAIPASQLKLGDTLLSGGKKANVVTKIQSVMRKGQFAPLTKTGTILVNDVYSSVYVSLTNSEFLEIIPGLSISMQWVAHTFTTLLQKCASSEEQYNKETGLANWIETPLKFSTWILNSQRSILLRLSIFIPGLVIGFIFWIMNTYPMILLLVSAVYFYNKKRVGNKEKKD